MKIYNLLEVQNFPDEMKRLAYLLLLSVNNVMICFSSPSNKKSYSYMQLAGY